MAIWNSNQPFEMTSWEFKPAIWNLNQFGSLVTKMLFRITLSSPGPYMVGNLSGSILLVVCNLIRLSFNVFWSGSVWAGIRKFLPETKYREQKQTFLCILFQKG